MPTAKRLPSGSYRALAYIGKDENGKRKYKSFTAPTKKEAELLAAQYIIEQDGQQSAGITVAEALEAYIAAKNAVLSPSTVLNYRAYSQNHYGDLKQRPINEITSAELQTMINLEAAMYGGKTVANAWGLLSVALAMFRPDFTPSVTLPRKTKTIIHIPSADDMALYYDAVRGHLLEIPFLLASQCGLRASEIAALRRDDLEGNMLHVRRARVRGADGVVVDKMPKTDAGYRAIPIADELLAILQQAEGERISPIDADQIPSRWAARVRSRSLPPCGFHALRHYFASRAALAGVPKMYLVELMGHSSSRMLDQVYMHTFPDEKAQFAAMLAGTSHAFFDTMQHEMQHKTNI